MHSDPGGNKMHTIQNMYSISFTCIRLVPRPSLIVNISDAVKGKGDYTAYACDSLVLKPSYVH